eukprot:jgi/Botrbrau1/22147/Bobra.0206s0071.1
MVCPLSPSRSATVNAVFQRKRSRGSSNHGYHPPTITVTANHPNDTNTVDRRREKHYAIYYHSWKSVPGSGCCRLGRRGRKSHVKDVSFWSWQLLQQVRPTPPDAPFKIYYDVQDSARNHAVTAVRLLSVTCQEGSTLCSDDETRTPYCSTNGFCIPLVKSVTTTSVASTFKPTVDAAQPVITLIGPQIVEVTQGLSYQKCPEPPPTNLACERGATAFDALEKDLSGRIEACSSMTAR